MRSATLSRAVATDWSTVTLRPIAAATLHVVVDEVIGDRVEHALRNLRAGGIVEEDERAGLLQCGEHGAHGLYREGRRRGFGGLGRMLVHGSLLESNGRV